MKDHYGEKEKEKEDDEKITVGMYVKNNIGDYAKIFEENIGLINGILKQWRSNNIKTLEDLNTYKLSKEQKGRDSMIFKLLMPIAMLVDIIVLLIVLGKVEKKLRCF